MEGWWIASYVVLWALVVALAVLVVALARQIGSLHLRLGPRGALELDDEGPPLGEAPESVQVATLGGAPTRIGGPGEAQLLLFVSPGCAVCDQVLPAAGAVAREGFRPYVLVDGGPGSAERLAARRSLRAPVIPAAELTRGYAVPGTPYAVALDDLGVVRAKGTVNNLEQVEGLLRTAERRTQASSSEARVGELEEAGAA